MLRAGQHAPCTGLLAVLRRWPWGIQVGPSSGVLKGQSPEQWAPKDVAQTVLADKCAASRIPALLSLAILRKHGTL